MSPNDKADLLGLILFIILVPAVYIYSRFFDRDGPNDPSCG